MPEEELIKEPISVKREVEVLISAQARRVLIEANIKEEDFINWALQENKVSYGGHHVMLYMEKLYEEKRRKGDPK